MRISDWSSDVCSSDLVGLISNPAYDSAMFLANMTTVPVLAIFIIAIETEFFDRYQAFYRAIEAHATWREIRENPAGIIRSPHARSAARGVGKGCVRTFRYRWSPSH